ncbi:uncharacterized protein [Antedon mediterranea]|uniref:uncharacterized protein n=1 Tax=Antedon mediterranea TaxID=105859 RepID=UPI003AF849DB
MSPEVMNGSQGVDHFKSDVYSLGIVLWELYHQRRPYEDLNVPNIIQHVVNYGHPEIDAECDVRLRDVMLKCWNYQPDQRPHAEQILTSLDNGTETFVRSRSKKKKKQISGIHKDNHIEFRKINQPDQRPHPEQILTSLDNETETFVRSGSREKQKQILGIHKDTHIEFRKLLSDLSKDYVGLKYRWLRMLLHGIIPIGCLEVSTIGLQLFNELVELGKISKTDVSLLSEVAETTEQTSAKDRIVDYKRTIQCSETLGTSLTSYRKALFEALRNVGLDDLLKVIGFYKLKDYGFNNIWDVVFYLEKEKLLDDTQDKLKLFADLLNEMARSILLAAPKTLERREKTNSSPHVNAPLDWQKEGLRRIKENDLKRNYSGTVRVYDREFKFDGGHEWWKFFSTATDIATGIKAKAGGYKSMGGANEHAIENLIYKLMAQGIIRN